MLFLRIQLGAHPYLLDTSQIVEILPLVEWRRLAGSPPAVLGVFSYHGTVVPVLDLRALALGESASVQATARIAVVNYPVAPGETRLLGLLLENATDFMRRARSDFSALPVAGAQRFGGAVAADRDGLIQQIELNDLVPADLWSSLSPAAPQETT